ncbi:hypothetical protein [Cereibacter sphaeroides]|uniref:hypothetical protein n=1 Tax=Cereibacter sphaeroides TaxID=1063 RepID=UPI0009E60208|nr:hypothetical protein [Cereibacter sphaeroides]
MVSIDSWSVKVCYLEMLFNEQVLSHGTGFLLRMENPAVSRGSMLITNWHNVTGRHRETNNCLDEKNAAVPNALRVYFRTAPFKLYDVAPYTVRLYSEDGEPQWLEHKDEDAKVDVVAIPCQLPDGLQITCLNDDLGDGTVMRGFYIGTGSEVFIIGFPFKLKFQPLPIWKRASVASEPLLAEVHRSPCFYVDTASRPGMSGSLVIQVANSGIYINSDGDTVVAERGAAQIVGVYSGRINVKEDLQLGIVWPWSVVENILQQPRVPKNPHI